MCAQARLYVIVFVTWEVACNISGFPGLPSEVRNCTLFILGNHILHSDISAQKSRTCTDNDSVAALSSA